MKSRKRDGFGAQIKPKHKSACRAFGYALAVPDEASMWTLSASIYALLQSNERVFAAVAFLAALPDDEYEDVIDFMLGES